ncbi:H4 protein, partial [Hemiprocne comata]|nr:H4 protein [Hemiprocne comata]
KVLCKNIQGITKPGICCLAHSGSVKHILDLIYKETCGMLKVFLENVICNGITYIEHAKMKAITAMDMVYALKHQGSTLCGFGV